VEVGAPSPARAGALRPALLVLKALVSVGLLAWLLRSIDIGDMLRRFSNLRWGWLAVGFGLHQLQSLISARKWQLILAADGQRVGYFFLFRIVQIGAFLSLFLPTSFGGDVYRAWALNQIGVKTSKAAASVLFDRLSGLFALLTIGVVGCVLLLDARSAVLLLVGYVFGVATFTLVTGDAVVARLPQTSAKYVGFPFRIIRSFNTYRHRPAFFTQSLLLSAAFQFNVVLIVTTYARSLQIGPGQISFLEMVAVIPVIFLSEVLPSINGIGVRDGAFVFFFALVGSTGEQAMAVSLMVLVLRYVQSLLGAFFWVAARKSPIEHMSEVQAAGTALPPPA
jgi:uncharacterized membrane protein YbhN (UPF0104 family)